LEVLVSPRGRVASREHWISTAADLVSQGRPLGEVSIPELEQAAGATRGSLYTYFPKLADLHRAVIEWWREQRSQTALDSTVRSVADPLERLRLLRAVIAGNAVRDDAMRRWAHTEPAAAAAVAEADHAAIAHVHQALQDLGYSAGDADALAPLMAGLFSSARPGAFELLLRLLARAVAVKPDVEVTQGTDADEIVLYTIAKDLPAAARRQLREEAQRFAAAVKDHPGQSDDGEGTVA
jgi:AcrR family transcriptional regulator